MNLVVNDVDANAGANGGEGGAESRNRDIPAITRRGEGATGGLRGVRRIGDEVSPGCDDIGSIVAAERSSCGGISDILDTSRLPPSQDPSKCWTGPIGRRKIDSTVDLMLRCQSALESGAYLKIYNVIFIGRNVRARRSRWTRNEWVVRGFSGTH